MSKLFIPVIAGTMRPDRMSIHAARFVHQIVAAHPELETELIDPVDVQLPLDGISEMIRDPHYHDVTARADAFIIVTPEYNHSIPGSLKRMLDSEFENYRNKAVAMVGVSDGPWGGVRALEVLSNVTRTLWLKTLRNDLQFPLVKEIFTETGEFRDPVTREKFEKRVGKLISELLWLAQTLKWGREHIV